MNDYAILPVNFIFDDEGNRRVLNVTRIPCAGEYVHFEEQDKPEFLAKVLVVTHLVWSVQRPEAVADIHCVRVPDLSAEHLRVSMAREERTKTYE